MRHLPLTCLLCLIAVINLDSTSLAATIQVPQDYLTIQEAVNAAQAGDTIQVAAGTYHEHLVIAKSIQLMGEDRETTIIDGSYNGTVIQVYHDGLVLSDFTVQNSTSGWPHSGIIFHDTGNHHISNNKFTNNFIGIHLSNSSHNTVSDNIIENNSHHGLSMFAYATACSSNQITGNSFNNNPNMPIFISNAQICTLSGNLITDGTYYGITLTDTDDCVISDNQISDHKHYGISLTNAEDCTLSGNLVIDTDNHGIALINTDNCEVIENTFTTNAYAVLASESRSLEIRDNDILDCRHGVRTESNCSNVTVTDNQIFGVQFWGLSIHADQSIISQNRVDSSNGKGIIVQGNENTINENYMANCMDKGLHLEDDSWDNSIYHNTFLNAASIGAINTLNNTWDDGYPSGGNYWFDYTGVDTNGDGIGDTPYMINVYNIDNYPLMQPIHTVTWGVTNLDTTETFLTIQNAIDDPDTLTGHTISVSAGIYGETLVIDKTINLEGENKNTTFIHSTDDPAISVQAEGCTIRNFTITSNHFVIGEGMRIDSVNNVISNNTIKDMYGDGIRIYDSNNMVIDNEIVNCSSSGIILLSNSYNTIIGNSITDSYKGLIYLSNSSHNVISDNHLDNLNYTQYGIDIIGSSSNNIICNNIIENVRGIGIRLYSQTNSNTILNNLIRHITYHDGVTGVGIQVGVYSGTSLILSNTFTDIYNVCLRIYNDNNKIYGNNFDYINGRDIYFHKPGHGDLKVAPYPMGGNYYSDYTGQDSYSGSRQDQPGSDGIGDIPHTLKSGQKDPFPLMNPYQGLSTDAFAFSASAGGQIHFSLDAGNYHGFKNYVILGSATHIYPGTPLPGTGLTLPFNWDGFTNLMIPHLNTPLFQNFLGVLDANGSASALLQTGTVSPDAAGLTLTFSYFLYQTYDMVSNPVTVTILP